MSISKSIAFNGKAPIDQATYLWLVKALHELKPGQVDEATLQSFMHDLLQNQVLETFEPNIKNELIVHIIQQSKRLGLEHENYSLPPKH